MIFDENLRFLSHPFGKSWDAFAKILQQVLRSCWLGNLMSRWWLSHPFEKKILKLGFIFLEFRGKNLGNYHYVWFLEGRWVDSYEMVMCSNGRNKQQHRTLLISWFWLHSGKKNDVIADLKENHASPVSPQKNPCTYNLTSISQWRCISGCIVFAIPYCFPLINCRFTPTYPNIPAERNGHDAEPEYPILNESHRNSWKNHFGGKPAKLVGHTNRSNRLPPFKTP